MKICIPLKLKVKNKTMDKIHLNYYELSENMREEIKQFILKQAMLDKIDISFDSLIQLMELNNAGIDIDIFSFMTTEIKN